MRTAPSKLLLTPSHTAYHSSSMTDSSFNPLYMIICIRFQLSSQYIYFQCIHFQHIGFNILFSNRLISIHSLSTYRIQCFYFQITKSQYIRSRHITNKTHSDANINETFPFVHTSTHDDDSEIYTNATTYIICTLHRRLATFRAKPSIVQPPPSHASKSIERPFRMAFRCAIPLAFCYKKYRHK